MRENYINSTGCEGVCTVSIRLRGVSILHGVPLITYRPVSILYEAASIASDVWIALCQSGAIDTVILVRLRNSPKPSLPPGQVTRCRLTLFALSERGHALSVNNGYL